MKYKIQLHKRKIYIRPVPKKDIKDGLVVILNKPRNDKSEPFIACDIKEGEGEYKLPDLPQGIWVLKIFIKDDKSN